MSDSMTCLVYAGKENMQLLERQKPSLEDGEVVLKIEAVGICGSDMHCYHGHDPRRLPGLVLGHEYAGAVVESKDANFPVGTRVTGNPLITCGVCDYCQMGRNNLCSNRSMVGMTRDGAHAECMSTPGKCLLAIPDDMSFTTAAITEPAATALHAVNAASGLLHRPLAEEKILVIGGGAIGFLTALLLKHYGCTQITVAETHEARRNMLEQHIGVHTYNPIQKTLADSSCGCVIDAVGSKATRKASLQAVKPGGAIVHVGLQDWASEIDMRKLTLAEISLKGVYTYSTTDLKATLALLDSGGFGDLSWTLTMPLSQGKEAFDALHEGKISSGKVILLPYA